MHHDHSHEHSHNHSHGHNHSHNNNLHNHPKPVYVAIIHEQSVDVYDIKGQIRTFRHTTTESSSVKIRLLQHDMRKICFSSHGNDVDSLLTPCFDQYGCHGLPETGCFCGVDKPHIHAHFRDAKMCDVEGAGISGGSGNVLKLANLTLFPEDNDDPYYATTSSKHNEQSTVEKKRETFKNKRSNSMPLSASLPIQCNSKEYKKILRDRGVDESIRQEMFKVFHHDHYDVLVHNQTTGNLQLEHNCNDCGDTDIHGQLNLVCQRSWSEDEDEIDNNNTNVNTKKMRLNFYRIPKKTFGLLDTFIHDLFKTDSTDRVNVIRHTATPKRGYSLRSYQPKFSTCVTCTNDEVTDLLANDAFTANAQYSGTKTEAQSKIFVQQICCASEIPMINNIVKPIEGVSDVRVNTTTKIVYVSHDPDKVSAEDIVSALNREKFGAKLKVDGSIALRASKILSLPSTCSSVQSKIFVQQICCASEIPMINDIVKPLAGVTDVKVNTLTKIVYVTHDPIKVSAQSVEAALNKANFGARIELDGAENLKGIQNVHQESNLASLTRNGDIKMVESTLLVLSLFDDTVATDVKKILSQQYTKDQVSHVETHVMSGTIKIDHNPYLVKVVAIKHLLMAHKKIDITIHTDGFEEGVWAIKTDDVDIEEHKSTLRWNVALAGVFWIISLLYLIGGAWEYLEYLGLVSVALGIPKIAMKALTTMRRFQFDTNCMMLFATIGAVALQDYTEAAAVAFLFSLSEWLESLSTARARNALSSIAKLRPDRARVRDNATNTFRIVPATSVVVGSIVSVPTGDKVPCDGIVVEGTSTMDESSLTGESRPIQKGVGDSVSGGTINSGRSQLLVKTTSLSDDSAVARLIRLVEEAQTNRSPTEQLIDEFAKRYTPIVVLAAISMCTFPWIVDVETGRIWTEMGLITIVIACPCALIISTPVTYVAGIAAAAQNGIVVKGGVHLEVSCSV